MIVISPFKKQREAAAIADENFFSLYGGAIRGGKTWWLILMLWSYALKYKKSRWAIIRKTHTVLQSTTIVTFNELIALGLEKDIANYNKQTNVVTLRNGSQLIFMAEQFDTDKELNRFRGLEVNGFGLDELNELQEVTLYKCFERAGSWQHSKNCPNKVIATCNPTRNWVKEKIYDVWKIGALKKGWAYIPARIFDNPNISKEYLETLKLMPSYQYRSFVEGDWEALPQKGSEFINTFDFDKHVKPASFNPELPLHISFDQNVVPYITALCCQVEKKDEKYKVSILKEYALKNPQNNTEVLSRKIIEDFAGKGLKQVFIYGDATGKKRDTRGRENDYDIIKRCFAKYLANSSMRVPAGNPSVSRTRVFCNKLFNSEFKHIEIHIDSSCKYLIGDIENVKEDVDGGMIKEKYKDSSTGQTYEKYGHHLDAMRYFLTSAFRATFNLMFS